MADLSNLMELEGVVAAFQFSDAVSWVNIKLLMVLICLKPRLIC